MFSAARMQSESQISAHNLEIEAHGLLRQQNFQYDPQYNRRAFLCGPPKQQIPHQIKALNLPAFIQNRRTEGGDPFIHEQHSRQLWMGKKWREKSIWEKRSGPIESISKCGRCVQDSRYQFPSDFLHWRPTIERNSGIQLSFAWVKLKICSERINGPWPL